MNPDTLTILTRTGLPVRREETTPVVLTIRGNGAVNVRDALESMRDVYRQACVLHALDTHMAAVPKTMRIEIQAEDGLSASARIVGLPDQFIDRLHMWTAVLYALCNDIEGVTGIDADEIADLVMDTVADREGGLIEDLILGGIADEL